MTILLNIAKKFGVSRPVFSLQLSTSGYKIDANQFAPIHKYNPKSIGQTDVITEMVVRRYNEDFNCSGGRFIVNPTKIAEQAMEDIRNKITKFIEKNLDMKAPTQSKLYRWAYRSMPKNIGFNDVLVSVYKYLCTFCTKEMETQQGADKHGKNAIALLEAMMEKYSEQ